MTSDPKNPEPGQPGPADRTAPLGAPLGASTSPVASPSGYRYGGHDEAEDHSDVVPMWRIVSPRAAIATLLIILAIVALARSFFFVDETEYVYVTQFGRPIRLCVAAGLEWKWPFQSLWRFDRRLRIYSPPAREMLTQDKENLNVEWYVCWRLPGRSFVESQAGVAPLDATTSAAVDGASAGDAPSAANDRELLAAIEPRVRQFLQSVGNAEAAERRLEERIQSSVAAELGRIKLANIVSLDHSQLALDGLMARVTDDIRRIAAEQYGVEVVDVRIKRFNYPESVKPAVFAEIRSERARVADQYRAEGRSQATKIRSLADMHRDQILSQAEREAIRIRGEGEAKAIEIYNAAHGQDPAFYELLKTLETYRAILDDQTTVVLSAESPLLRLLTKGLPGLVPADGEKPLSPVQPVARESEPAIERDAAAPQDTALADEATEDRP